MVLVMCRKLYLDPMFPDLSLTIITLFDIDAYRLIIENVSSFEPSSLIYNVKSWQDCDNMLSIKSVI